MFRLGAGEGEFQVPTPIQYQMQAVPAPQLDQSGWLAAFDKVPGLIESFGKVYTDVQKTALAADLAKAQAKGQQQPVPYQTAAEIARIQDQQRLTSLLYVGGGVLLLGGVGLLLWKMVKRR